MYIGFYPVSMDYGLSVRTAVCGHAISGLPHEPATIFHGYIVRVRSPSFHSARVSSPLSLLFTSLVRNPISIEERFNPDESTRASSRKRGKVKSPFSFYLQGTRGVVSLSFILVEILAHMKERERDTCPAYSWIDYIGCPRFLACVRVVTAASM